MVNSVWKNQESRTEIEDQGLADWERLGQTNGEAEAEALCAETWIIGEPGLERRVWDQ